MTACDCLLPSVTPQVKRMVAERNKRESELYELSEELTWLRARCMHMPCSCFMFMFMHASHEAWLACVGRCDVKPGDPQYM